MELNSLHNYKATSAFKKYNTYLCMYVCMLYILLFSFKTLNKVATHFFICCVQKRLPFFMLSIHGVNGGGMYPLCIQ